MSRPRALAAVLRPVTRQALGRSRTAVGSLIADWAAIVGEATAARAVPEKLTFPRGRRDGGTVVLRVAAADALRLQHEAPRILERINGHYGYRAVERLKLVQGTPVRPPAGPVRRPLGAGDRAAIADAVADVADAALRDRLAALGRALYGRAGD
jgi:hypothetical protein